MEETSNLSLPYILPSQAQKHVTHNEALRRLDALVQLAVLSRELAASPGAPGEGDRYIVGAPASGDWVGHEGEIAAWQDGAWEFYLPRPGWIATVLDEDAACFWDGESWRALGGGTGSGGETDFQNIASLGVGTEADATNIFAAKLNDALWTAKPVADGGTGDLRYKMNKEGAANVLSLLMQRAYSGRAEIGLIGSDNLSVKVSPDGANWLEALEVDCATGAVSMPKTNILTDYCVNLYADSGRFAGTGVNAIAVGSFSLPAYLFRQNSTTVAGLAKFLHNNTDHGGTAGTLNASVRALVEMIRDVDYRRYGVEFWVAEFTHGAGTANVLPYGSQNWYLSLMTGQTLRAPNMTFHAYFRAMDEPVLIRCNAGQTIISGGSASEEHLILQPGDGWRSVTVKDSVSVRASYGYMPMVLSLYCKASTHRYQMACPALMGGITSVDSNAGVIAATTSWPA
ncbi:MAG: DUF2793 domain-containing protein [Rhizobiaceae bacterium]|nr:DUF2793 domain-containing protein [Rhizobiaceae bacterium]